LDIVSTSLDWLTTTDGRPDRSALGQRIDQAQVDLNHAVKDAQQQAGEATANARSKWAQVKADVVARMDDVKAKIDQRNRQLDAKAAARDADWVEGDAADAIDYPAWTVDNARLAVLDAIDARAYARTMSRFFHPLTWRACHSTAIDSTVRTNPSDSPTTPASQSRGATTLHLAPQQSAHALAHGWQGGQCPGRGGIC
jgi:hypothetical protein